MKLITFESLKLVNFCGIRDLQIDFNGRSTNISARNGAGKSTIARAITYVLFGTDLSGNQFDIKTYDENHRIIPEIEHSAELIMNVNDESVTLKRTLTDSWKGESVKNTYQYYVNGEVTTATDFKKKVDSIFPEVTFRLASSPIFFLAKPWQEQRKFLESLVPQITTETITGGDEKYDMVVEALRKESIDKYVSHIKYNKGEVQKQLEDIPVKIATLNKTLPEAQDWESLKAEKDNLQKEYNTLHENLIKAKDGGAETIRMQGLQHRYDLAEKRKREMEKSARVMAGEAEVKHSSDVINARTKHQKLEAMVNELQAKMDGFTDTEVHIKQQIDEYKSIVKVINEQKAQLEKLQWKWDDRDNVCPHCGQLLPAGDLSLLKQESEKNFNQKKAEGLKKFAEQFAATKAKYDEAKNLLAQLNDDRHDTTILLKDAHGELKEAEKQLTAVKADTPKDSETLLRENPNYKQVLDELLDLKKQMDSREGLDEDTQKLIASLETQMSEKQSQINALQDKLKMEDTFKMVSHYIEEAQADKKKFQEQIDELDQKLDIANEYYEKSCSILEEEVNNHFSFVKWSMFKSNLSGDKQPYCECYHEGVPYSSLNSSAKVNAGIDIANTIARYYDVSVPIILDNCESNLHPLYSLGQQIRLSVTHDENIKVEQLEAESYAD